MADDVSASASVNGGVGAGAERTAFQEALDNAKESRQIEAVIAVMEKYHDSAYIQRSGCEVLQGQFLQDLARVQMDDDRFVQVPLRAMAKHIQVRDEDGWYIACCFLRSLAHQSDAKKVALCHQGAVRALQHSMHVFRASARVQTVAISCLHVLAFVEANRAEIGQRSCVGLVVGALQAHMDDAILVLCGCRLLQMVALNDAFKVPLLEEGAVEVVFRCLGRHLTPDIAGQCCGFFYFLADQIPILPNNGTEQLAQIVGGTLLALKTFPTLESVQREGVATLALLCDTCGSDVLALIVAEDGFGVVRESLVNAALAPGGDQMDTAEEAISIVHALVMDQDIRQLVSGLPAVLDAVEDLLEPPEQRQNSVPLSDMVRSSAIMIRKELRKYLFSRPSDIKQRMVSAVHQGFLSDPEEDVDEGRERSDGPALSRSHSAAYPPPRPSGGHGAGNNASGSAANGGDGDSGATRYDRGQQTPPAHSRENHGSDGGQPLHTEDLTSTGTFLRHRGEHPLGQARPQQRESTENQASPWDAVPSVQPMTILSGFLRKKDDGQMWKHRWFELVPSENILRYFSSPEDEIPRAVVPLASIYDAALGPQPFAPRATESCIVLRVHRQPSQEKNHQHRDGAPVSLVNFVLEALNVAEAKLWVKALHIYIERGEEAAARSAAAAHKATEEELEVAQSQLVEAGEELERLADANRRLQSQLRKQKEYRAEIEKEVQRLRKQERTRPRRQDVEDLSDNPVGSDEDDLDFEANAVQDRPGSRSKHHKSKSGPLHSTKVDLGAMQRSLAQDTPQRPRDRDRRKSHDKQRKASNDTDSDGEGKRDDDNDRTSTWKKVKMRRQRQNGTPASASRRPRNAHSAANDDRRSWSGSDSEDFEYVGGDRRENVPPVRNSVQKQTRLSARSTKKGARKQPSAQRQVPERRVTEVDGDSDEEQLGSDAQGDAGPGSRKSVRHERKSRPESAVPTPAPSASTSRRTSIKGGERHADADIEELMVAMYAALSQSQGGVLKVSFLRNFFRGCGLLKDPIIRAKLDVMLQQYPVKRHGAFTPSRNSRRGSRRGNADSVSGAGGSGLTREEFLDILHAFVPRCFPGESRQQALRTFVLRHGLNRLSHYAGAVAPSLTGPRPESTTNEDYASTVGGSSAASKKMMASLNGSNIRAQNGPDKDDKDPSKELWKYRTPSWISTLSPAHLGAMDSVFNANAHVLVSIFKHYVPNSAKDGGPRGHTSANPRVPWEQFGRFCHDFRLVPNILSRGDCSALWAHNAIIQRHLRNQSKYTTTSIDGLPQEQGIDIKQFMWMLACIAAKEFSHPQYECPEPAQQAESMLQWMESSRGQVKINARSSPSPMRVLSVRHLTARR